MSNRPMQKFVADYTTDVQISAKNCLLFHLAVSNNSNGTIWVQIWDVSAKGNIGTQAMVPDFEYAIPASPAVAALPFHKEGWQLGKGLYVRAVTASQGSTLIGGNYAKFTCQWDGPWPIT